ncbi:hypothetical protein [Streptomyces sp. NPDC018833]|uniref:hypothetical protein n=1 Tax=Streptomyces sp. NPDC018833 TaxID=3365053 RepID=UPI0037A616BA
MIHFAPAGSVDRRGHPQATLRPPGDVKDQRQGVTRLIVLHHLSQQDLSDTYDLPPWEPGMLRKPVPRWPTAVPLGAVQRAASLANPIYLGNANVVKQRSERNVCQGPGTPDHAQDPD